MSKRVRCATHVAKEKYHFLNGIGMHFCEQKIVHCKVIT